MARTKQKKKTIGVAEDLRARIEKLVETARNEGRDDALAQVRHLLGGAPGKGAARTAERGSKGTPRKGTSKKAKRRNSWAGLTDEQRLVRVNAIRKGKGLPPRESL